MDLIKNNEVSITGPVGLHYFASIGFAVPVVIAGLVKLLCDQLAGKRVGLIVCGANIDEATFIECLQRGKPA